METINAIFLFAFVLIISFTLVVPLFGALLFMLLGFYFLKESNKEDERRLMSI
jgi:predicted membrane protein